ncbi:CDP-diacylglycerol--serine O-phosphatidyltransferase [Amycolatopsis minnesotensis]|uniref:CDP-diacylglycerol--serine O-phosphatidyltransferase n=1 Tax=Amycolatopsis minnesotensis TaxID=337894 RepID=A0ABN2Q3R5_9PSEU
MMARDTPGVRLLPNAITVLALCAGLSAVQFALIGNYQMSIASIGIAAILDSLDGRIARLLDATSKMGAELDSLSDAISFGVAPALVLYVWHADGERIGWIASLVFAVCMVLRLARFNTFLDDTEQPPYAAEFFVGVPAPAGGLLGLLPLIVTLEFGNGWWSAQWFTWLWTVAIAALLISRIPTLSLKTVKASPKFVAPLLVGVGLLAAAIISYPLIALAVALVLYLAHVPYSVYRHRWLAKHPEAWDVPPRERRAIRRSRGQRRLGLRRPISGRVAGAARRAVRLQRNGHGGYSPGPHRAGQNGRADGEDAGQRRRSWRRIGLRQRGNH